MVVSRNLGVGKVFSTNFAPDQEVGFRLAVAGSKGTVQIWDTSTNAAVRGAFASRVAAPLIGKEEGEVKERLVGVAEVESSSDDDDEEEAGEEGQDGGGGGGGGGDQGWESMEED